MYEIVEDSGRCYYIQSHMFFISGFCVTISSPLVMSSETFYVVFFFFSFVKTNCGQQKTTLQHVAGSQHPLDCYSKAFKISRHADLSTRPRILGDR